MFVAWSMYHSRSQLPISVNQIEKMVQTVWSTYCTRPCRVLRFMSSRRTTKGMSRVTRCVKDLAFQLTWPSEVCPIPSVSYWGYKRGVAKCGSKLIYVLHKYIMSRDLHVTPRSVPAQLRPAHDINLPLCFLGSSLIRCCACPSDHTVIISLLKLTSLVFFLGNGPFFSGENGRASMAGGLCSSPIPLNLGLTFKPRPWVPSNHIHIMRCCFLLDYKLSISGRIDLTI